MQHQVEALMAEYVSRFTGKAATYAEYRERYDSAIVLPYLRHWCGLTPDWSIADVGAGTGMVSDIFLANGNRVVAIEPNAEMRAACADLHRSDRDFTVLDGAAEHTGLPDGSVDMVAIGRALHWFNIDGAFAEFRRILKPRGWIAILACGRRDDGRDENVAFDALLDETTGRNSSPEHLLRVYDDLSGLFAGGAFHHEEVEGLLKLERAQMRGLALSISHTPLPAEPGYGTFEAKLDNFFEQFAVNGRVTFASRTWVTVGCMAKSDARGNDF